MQLQVRTTQCCNHARDRAAWDAFLSRIFPHFYLATVGVTLCSEDPGARPGHDRAQDGAAGARSDVYRHQRRGELKCAGGVN